MRIVSRALTRVKSRAREEADLLAGRNRDGAPGGEVLGHLRGRPCPRVTERRRGNARPRARREELAPALRRGLDRRRVGKELRKSREEVEEKRREPGVLGERDHEGLPLPRVDAGRRARTMRRGESGPAGDPSKSPQVASTGSPARQKSVTSSVRRVRAHALAEDLGRAFAADLDLLLDALRLGVPGTADRVLLFAATSALLGDEPFENPVASERVAEERSARPEHALDLGHDRHVLGLAEEIAEAREEVDDRGEGAVREGQRRASRRERDRAAGPAGGRGPAAAPNSPVRSAEGPLRRRARSGARIRSRGPAAGARRAGRCSSANAASLPGRIDVPVGVEVEVLLAEPRLPPRHGARLWQRGPRR